MNWGKKYFLSLAFVTIGHLASLFSGGANLLAQTRNCPPGTKPLYSMTMNNVASQQAATREAHLALMYYTTDGLKARVADVASEDGNPLVQEQGGRFLIWNAKGGHYDTLQAGLRVYDQKTGYKGVFTYDSAQDRIGVHNAGTNFSNKVEMFAAAKAMLNIVPPAAKVAGKYLDSALVDLQADHPEISKEKTVIDFYAHSIGAAVAVKGMDHARKEGWQTGEAVFADPYFAGKMVNKIVRNASADEKQITREFYENSSITMDPSKTNFIEWMPPFNLGKNIGTTILLENKQDISGHDIHTYVGRPMPQEPVYVAANTGCKI